MVWYQRGQKDRLKTNYENGADLYVVQRILGHKTAAMTQRYAYLAPENLREGVAVSDARNVVVEEIVEEQA